MSYYITGMSENEDQAGLAEAELPKEELEESKWFIPFNLSLDKLDLITMACFQSSADKQPVDATKISSASGIHVRTTIPNLNFLSAIGVVRPEGKAFSLTEEGTEYAKQLSSNEIANAGNTLRGLLPSSHLKDLLDYIEVHKHSNDLTYENLFARIRTLARIKTDEQGDISAPYKSGIRCLISLLGRAGFVSADIGQQAEAGKPVAALAGRRQLKTAKEAPIEQKKEREDIGTGKGAKGGETHVFQAPPFTVSITIEAKDSESIKQVRELIRELRGENQESAEAPG